ncbi:MAG TPA: hypothetical protein VFC82_06145 [Actinomycetaceae bacterium]|nr:hypothetical protein [Actinomycetaceae bacterium]
MSEGTEERWQRLFEEMSSWDEPAVDDAAVAELAQAERVGVTFGERMMGSVGSDVTVQFRSGTTVRGELTAVARDWCTVRSATADHVITTWGIAAVTSLGAPRGGPRPVPLGVPLRRIAAHGAPVVVDSSGVDQRGLLRSVAADHIDLLLDSGVVTTVSVDSLYSVRCARGAVTG